MKLRILASAVASLVIVLAFTVARAGDPSPSDLYKEGEKFYEEKTYKMALERFETVRKLAPEFEKKDELNIRIAICHMQLRQWMQAETELKVAAKGADQVKLRALMLLGQLYRDQPKELYFKGDDQRRGEWFEGASYRWTGAEDAANSLATFEEAKRVGYELRDLYAAKMVEAPAGARELEKKDRNVRDLTCELNFDLALSLLGSLPRNQAQRWTDPAADAKRYDVKWTHNEKIMFLLDEVTALDTTEKGGPSARAMRDKALYVLRRSWYFETKAEDNALGAAVEILRAAIAKHPKSGLAAELQYLLGRVFEERSMFVESIAEDRKVVAEHPDSKWVSDAKFHIQQNEAPRLQMNGMGSWLPDQKVQATIQHRNMQKVRFSLREFDLDRAWKNWAEEGRDDFELGDFATYAASRDADKLAGREVAAWTFDAQDDGRHAWRSDVIAVPINKPGPYLLTASASGIVSSIVVLVSDLVLVERLASQEAVFFLADSTTGKAVEGAEMRVVERWTWWDGNSRRSDDKKWKERTGADGLVAVKLANHNRGSRVQAYARAGDRFAATPANYHYNQRESARSPRIDAWTDRPVYRPGQTVSFKATARIANDTGYALPTDRNLQVIVRDPRGNVLFDQVLVSNDFGSVTSSVKLGEEPPLGHYNIQIRSSGVNGASNFRVEEYKKPEILVEVEAKTEQARLGEGLTAEIRANYFFGGGVPNADVRYRIERRDYHHWWRPVEDFDWFYGQRWGHPGRSYGGELIANGTGKTDEEGKFLVEWSTLKAKTELPDRDHEYQIHAEVTDSSRRTIEGSGTVRVTRTQMYATLFSRSGFYTAGDFAEVEIATQNASSRPLASEGNITVARLVWDATLQPQPGWRDEPILTEPMKTDDRGRGIYRWQADSQGQYAFIYDTKDAWGEKVQGRVHVNVADPNARDSAAKFREVELHPQQRTWKPGDTARVLLTCDRPGATVMLTYETSHNFLRREVVELKGKTQVLEIPLSDVHAPNFFLRALTVTNGAVHQEVTEIFVPPADKFLDVTITPDKPEYKPGEKARYEISVKDWKGNPASAEVGLTVIDKSVLYIAPETTPDIRQLFYGGRRYAGIELQSSRNYGTSAITVDGNQYPSYELHGDPGGWRGGRFRRNQAWSAGEDRESLKDLALEEEMQEMDHNESADDAKADGGELRGRAGGGKALESKKMKEPGAPPAAKPASLERQEGGPQQDPAAAPVVRRNFADTACFTPWVVTGADGKASIEFTMPDSLTTWRASARALDRETRVGNTSNESVTRKTVMIRLQAPRFFRERDELLLSAIVNNQGATEEDVKASLALEGGTLELTGDIAHALKIAAGGEARVDWKVKATKEGLARITVTGIGRNDSDAMMMEFPVYVHGMDKLQSWAGVIRDSEGSNTLTIDIPADRKVSTADLVVQVSPTMAGALLDALPYLIEYPYGCVEQTMSRFMPAVSVAQTLKQTGISLEDIGKRRALAYADLPPSKDPVFHTQALAHIVAQGLQRLYGFQNSSGGWGWWQSNEVDPFITAYVVNGLRMAKAAGFNVDEGRFQNGINALHRTLEKEEDLHRAAYCAYVLAECGKLDAKHRDHLFTRRGDMNSYGRALLAMAMHLAGDRDKAGICIRNMEDFVKVDEKNGLAWWAREDKWAWWYWYGDDVEGNSAILRAYLMVDEKNANVPRLAKWLLTNREGIRWKSTRDTAHAVLALCEYAKKSGELSPEYTADVELDGKLLKSFGVTADNVFTLHGETGLKGDALETGKHTLTVKKSGKGTAYYSVYLKYFTTEEDLKAGSSRMSVARSFYRLTPRREEGADRGRKSAKLVYDREELKSGATVTSGDLIEIEIKITADNDYEYLVFEDMKAAGCEPTEVRSGPVYGTIASNMELRDEKVAFFVSWLRRGEHKLSYRVRAEIPGSFHAMPVDGYAMYAPSVRAISDEFRLNIVDKPATKDEEKKEER